MKNEIIALSASTLFALTGCSEMHCDHDDNCPNGNACIANVCTANGAQPANDAGVPDDSSLPRCPAVGGISYERPKPNVMFLVDRSGSMADPGACASPPCQSKWEQLLSLGDYLKDVKSSARFGLSVFPALGSDGCAASSDPLVALTDAADSDHQLLDAIASIGPGGRTPLAAALDAVADTGALDASDRDNVIVLLTDGQPNCQCTNDDVCEQNAAVAAVDRLRNRAVPIILDVVGFSASATSASDTLNALAVAAGTAQQGPTSYYRADTIEDLIGQLYVVSAGLAPCRFDLDDRPAPGELVVHLDQTIVAACTDGASCDAGYTYDEGAGVVELHGTSCAAIRDGQCHDVWFDTSASP